MPRADYRCPACGVVVEDHVFAMAVGATAAAPGCPVCDRVMQVIPQFRMDLKTDGDGGQGFQKFAVTRQVPTRDGLVQRTEQVDSLHKLRQIERDSEQRYRNGEGEPIRFRGYANHASNLDRNSFGESGTIGGRAYDSGQAPAKKTNVGVQRHGQRKPRVPVARGGGVTALKER